MSRAGLLAMVGIACAGLSSCASHGRKQAEALPPQPPPLYGWNETVPAQGATQVRIELGEQKAYIYRGGQETAWTYLASGRSGHSTPNGTYKVMEKIVDKSSNRYGVIVDASGNVVDGDATAGREAIPAGGRFVGAPMPYWMRLTSYGIGMHAGLIPHPGLPASHGCIRLPQELAARLFDVVDVGTLVTINGSAPQG